MATEKSHKVQERWNVGEEKFNSAALSVIEESRNRAIGKIYAIAAERMFLLSLKRKYAGMLSLIFVIVIAVIAVMPNSK